MTAADLRTSEKVKGTQLSGGSESELLPELSVTHCNQRSPPSTTIYPSHVPMPPFHSGAAADEDSDDDGDMVLEAVTPEQLDGWIPTFQAMERRRLQRVLSGHSKEHTGSRVCIEMALLLVLFVIISDVVGTNLFDRMITDDKKSRLPIWLPILLSSAVTSLVVRQLLRTREHVIWTCVQLTLYLGFLWFAWAFTPQTREGSVFEWNDAMITIVVLTGSLVAFWVLLWVSVSWVYPLVVGRLLRSPRVTKWFWKLQPSPNTRGFVSYRPYGPLSSFFWGRYEFRYAGETDSLGVPHGYGLYRDLSPNGEILRGLWKNGTPIGPFLSQEHASGSVSLCRRIVYATSRAEDLRSVWALPARSPGGLRFGCCRVECSAGGGFFSYLPNVTKLEGDNEGCSLGKAVAGQTHLDKLRVIQKLPPKIGRELTLLGPVMDAPHISVAVVSQQEISRLTQVATRIGLRTRQQRFITRGASALFEHSRSPSEASPIQLRPLQPQTGQSSQTPASTPRQLGAPVRSMSGYSAVVRVGPAPRVSRVDVPVHMIAGRAYLCDGDLTHYQAGGLSSTTVQHDDEALVYLHGYNCSTEVAMSRLGQFLALARLPLHMKPFVFSQSTGCALTYHAAKRSLPVFARDLGEFMARLRKQGFVRVHFMAHSMGGRLLCDALPLMIDMGLFLRVRSRDMPPPPAEGPRCSVDDLDAVAPDMEACEPKMLLCNVILLHADYPDTPFRRDVLPKLLEFCERVTIYADKNDGALFWSELFNREKTIGRNPCSMYCTYDTDNPGSESSRAPQQQRSRSSNGGRRGAECSRSPLDNVKGLFNPENLPGAAYVDVMDSTFMDQNVHSIRHNYFNLNVQLVADISELITNGSPAAQRYTRLARTPGEANVYSFLCPPSFVKND